MTRPVNPGRTLPLLDGAVGGVEDQPPGTEPDPDCCNVDPADLPDRGSSENGARIVGLGGGGDPTFVQKKSNTNSNTDATISATFDAPPTPGNLLVAYYLARSAAHTASPPSGWTQGPTLDGGSIDNGYGDIFYKFATASEPSTVTVVKGSSSYAGLSISEYSGIDSFDTSDQADAVAATTSTTIGPLTPAAGRHALLYGAINQSSRLATFTWPGTWTELAQLQVNSSGPTGTDGYRIEASTAGAYSAAVTSDKSKSYGWAEVSFLGGADAAWIIPLPNANDGSDATCDRVTGTDVAVMDMGAAYRIASARLVIGCENAGARVYTIKGANEPDLSDEVLLATIAFTATGSFTGDELLPSWYTADSYRFLHLEGDDTAQDLCAWEAYEPTLATNHQHDASGIAYDNTDSGLTADDVQEAIDELAAGSAITDINDIPTAETNLAHLVTDEAGGNEWRRDRVTTTDPTTGDDDADGYDVGSRWINTSSAEEFVCTDPSTGAAVWASTTDGGGGGVSGVRFPLTFVVDGGGAAITGNPMADVEVPAAGTIVEWTLLADQSGSVVVDVWKDTYANFPPVVGDSIAASAKPTLSSASKATDATLTGWTTALAQGDVIRFHLDSASTITRFTLTLIYERA